MSLICVVLYLPLFFAPRPLSSLPLNPFFHPSFSLLPSFHSSCTSSLYSGCCQASDMYVEQLKDVLKHSCPKRIAGFFAEPIQVRLTTRTQTGKVCNLCYLSLSIPSLFHLPSPVSPFSFSLFLPPPSFSPSFSFLFFLSLFLPPLLSLPLSSSPFFLFRFLPPSISSQGVGGSVQLPKGFLKKAFEAVREKGGLCISDEVGEEEDHTHRAIRTSYLFIF